MEAGRPVFIIGTPRSGTSLVSRIIDSHPEIGVPFESHIYPTLYGWRNWYGDLDRAESREHLVEDMLNIYAVQDWDEIPEKGEVLERFERHDFHGAFEAVVGAWSSIKGKRRWGEKTPSNILFWREILEGFPKAKFVHIVRDGRDVAMSWKRVRFGPRHFYTIAELWKAYLDRVERVRSRVGNNQLREIRYEDLLMRPEETVRGLSEFLNIGFVPRMLSFYENVDSYPTDARNERNLSRPLMKDNMEKWRTGMSRRDLRRFEAVAGSTLERFGYERGCPEANLSKEEIWKMRLLECPISRLYGLVRNVRGYLHALQIWVLYGRIMARNLFSTGGRLGRSPES